MAGDHRGVGLRLGKCLSSRQLLYDETSQPSPFEAKILAAREPGLLKYFGGSLRMRTSFRHLLVISLACALGALTVQGQNAQGTPVESPAHSSPVAQAQGLLNAGQIDAAIETLTAASGLKPRDVQVQHLLGLAYYRKGDYKRAVEYLSAAVRQTPEGSRQHREEVQALGLSHYMLGHI